MDMAVQSPPINEMDVATALNHAIKSKKGKVQPDGTTRNLCLVLLNTLDLDIGSQSNMWEDVDLTTFHAVILINGYSTPSIELIKGRF